MLNRFLFLVAILMLPACTNAADVTAGRQYFSDNCSLCHDASPSKATFQGPPLFGVMGRKVGSVKGFAYSAALTTANGQGRVWTAATLDRFLRDPQADMPGTAMPVKVESAQDRKVLIAYLSSLNGGTKPAKAAAPTSSGVAALDWRKDAPGVKHTVTVADLPAPYATQSAGNGAQYVDNGALPKVPDGFTISVFANGLDGPRAMKTAPNGDLFVVEEGRGVLLVYRNRNGVLDTKPETFATDLDGPFGVDFYPAVNPQWVYIANTTSVVRVSVGGGAAETVVPHLATGGGHTTRGLAFSPDGQYMYVSVGSASNDAEGMDRTPPGGIDAWKAAHGLGASWGGEDGRALVLRFAPDGSGRHVVATGIRNCVTLGFRPGTNDLYCTTNERDALGDNLVPDYFTRVGEGQFFGWPWYYLGDHEDPRHKGERPDLRGHITVPDLLFGSHSAPLGFTFYHAPAGAYGFPADYEGNAFVALHGSWNRSQRTGSKVVRVRIVDGKPDGSYEDFMTGLIIDDHRVAGRPVGLAVGPDGALYVSDDAGGRIWRIAAK